MASRITLWPEGRPAAPAPRPFGRVASLLLGKRFSLLVKANEVR